MTGFVALGVVVFLAGAVSTLYLGRIYRRGAAPRSLIFRALVHTCITAVAATAWLLSVQVAREAGAPIGAEVARTGNVIAAIVALCPPLYWALTIWRIRRRGLADVEEPVAILASILGATLADDAIATLAAAGFTVVRTNGETGPSA